MINKVNTQYVAGVDEVGRGPLAGPVVAAAVILDPGRPIAGLRDSKQLTAKRREQLAVLIHAYATCYAYGRAEVEEIDQLNILQASLLAMQRAVQALSIQPRHVLVDGNHMPNLNCSATAIVKGDAKKDVIAAASIIAKVKRDKEMLTLHQLLPHYGFDQHKGYPTKLHMQTLRQHGVTKHHRRSFRPVKTILLASKPST